MNEWLITWLTMWPLWAGMLLCLPAIMMSPGFGCCEDDCGCTTGTNPETWTVVISGIANDECDECDSYNGTYELTRVADSSCEWEYVFDDCTCCCPESNYVDRISLSVAELIGGDIRVSVRFRIVYGYVGCEQSQCGYTWSFISGAYYQTTSCPSGCICPPAPITYEGNTIAYTCEGGECVDYNYADGSSNTCGWHDDFAAHDCSVFEDTSLPLVDSDCYAACDFTSATCTVTANGPYS